MEKKQNSKTIPELPEGVFDKDKHILSEPTKTTTIRVDVETHDRLRKMADRMTVAGYLRAFSEGLIDLGKLPGYEDPVCERLDRMENKVDKIHAEVHAVLQKLYYETLKNENESDEQ